MHTFFQGEGLTVQRFFSVAAYTRSGTRVEIGTDASPWGLGGYLSINHTIVRYFASAVSAADCAKFKLTLGDPKGQQVVGSASRRGRHRPVGIQMSLGARRPLRKERQCVRTDAAHEDAPIGRPRRLGQSSTEHDNGRSRARTRHATRPYVIPTGRCTHSGGRSHRC